jgi:hypothetical protein
MSFYWIYDIPLLLAFVIVAGVFTLYAVGGLWIARRTFHKKLVYSHDRNEQVSFFMSSIGVFYGITLGLVAVGTWESFEQVQERVSRETAMLGALYRDINNFPEPKRTVLQDQLKVYTKYTIEEAWPLQQQGIFPTKGIPMLTQFQDELYTFEPAGKREEIIFAEVLRIYNDFLTMRRLRLLSVHNGLPHVVWMVTIVGALVSISFFWFFIMKNKIFQYILTTILSFFIGTMIFLIAMMDNPFRGKISVTPESFQILYEQMLLNK